MDQRRRSLENRLNLPASKVSLFVLHRSISQATSRGPIDDYVRSVKLHSHPALDLFDGSPPLPVQPSPATFKFLAVLHRTMFEAGNDLWNSHCVFELKGVILDALWTQLDDSRFTRLSEEVKLINGHIEAEDGNKDEKRDIFNGTSGAANLGKDKLLQNLFDVHYLRRSLYRPKYDRLDQGVLGGLVRVMRQELDLDDASNERLQKSANEYWKRTYLLFGLLASGSGETNE